jgi:hypothetical protein
MASTELPPEGLIERECSCLMDFLRSLDPHPKCLNTYIQLIGGVKLRAAFDQAGARVGLNEIIKALQVKPYEGGGTVLGGERWTRYEETCLGSDASSKV